MTSSRTGHCPRRVHPRTNTRGIRICETKHAAARDVGTTVTVYTSYHTRIPIHYNVWYRRVPDIVPDRTWGGGRDLDPDISAARGNDIVYGENLARNSYRPGVLHIYAPPE